MQILGRVSCLPSFTAPALCRSRCVLGQRRCIPSCEGLPDGVSPDHQLIARPVKSDRDQFAVFLSTGSLSTTQPLHGLVTVAAQVLARLLVMAGAVAAPAGSEGNSDARRRAALDENSA